MNRPSIAKPLIEARQIARDHGLHMKEKPLAPGTTHYYVYRKLADGHLTFLGKRGTPAGVRALVVRLASIR